MAKMTLSGISAYTVDNTNIGDFVKVRLAQRTSAGEQLLYPETCADNVIYTSNSGTNTTVQKLLSQIEENTSEVGSTFIVDSIEARDALTPTRKMFCWVADARGDSTVSGEDETKIDALYFYTGSEWKKIYEAEGMDLVLDWSDIVNADGVHAAEDYIAELLEKQISPSDIRTAINDVASLLTEMDEVISSTSDATSRIGKLEVSYTELGLIVTETSNAVSGLRSSLNDAINGINENSALISALDDKVAGIAEYVESLQGMNIDFVQMEKDLAETTIKTNTIGEQVAGILEDIEELRAADVVHPTTVNGAEYGTVTIDANGHVKSGYKVTPIANGGTGAGNAADARKNLGVAGSDELASLTESVNGLGVTVSSVQGVVNTLSESVASLEESVPKLDERLTAIEPTVSEHSEKLAALETTVADVEQLKADVETLDASVDTFTDITNSLTSRVEQNESDIDGLKEGLENVTGRMSAAESAIDYLEQDVTTLNTNYGLLSLSLDAMSKTVSEHTTDIATALTAANMLDSVYIEDGSELDSDSLRDGALIIRPSI